MKKNDLIKRCYVFIIVFLSICISASTPTCKVGTSISLNPEIVDYFNKSCIFNHFNKYDISEITPDDLWFYHIYSLAKSNENKLTSEKKWYNMISPLYNSLPINPIIDGGLMDSAWSMYCHDVRHTGRSPYSTVDTWDEIWRFKQDVNDYVRGSPIIGDDGTIYFGGSGDFYALYPNGTMKWKYNDLSFYVWSAPAIDENGTIYVADLDGYFYAIYPNGTLKWSILTGDDIVSSPAIGSDGTIFFGDGGNWNIKALYPNGTSKWSYKTDFIVYSSPAIGNDGIVYCGSHDTYLYALYSNNGSLKWRYKTDGWIRTSPCIADDGTIYVVSLDNHLHAVNPDGTLKWKTNMGNAGTSPTIGQDGTIYCGYYKLFAINPINGSVNWTFDVGSTIKGSTPAHSLEDTIYFGAGTCLFAVNQDGTLKWRKQICNEFIDSAPAISTDGTIYVGSADSENHGGNIYNVGYLHAISIGPLEADADGPYYGLINQPVQFKGSPGGGYSPYTYNWDFGDDTTSDEQNPIHIYTEAGNYTVTLTVTDNTSNTSSDTSWAWIQETNNPPDKPTINGTTKGEFGISYDYKFKTIDPDGTDILWYYVDWGDGRNTGWIGPYSSNEEVTKSHFWYEKGTYTIKCKAKDPYNAESDWGTLEVTMPRNRESYYSSLFMRFLERFPFLEKLLFLLK